MSACARTLVYYLIHYDVYYIRHYILLGVSLVSGAESRWGKKQGLDEGIGKLSTSSDAYSSPLVLPVFHEYYLSLIHI